MTSRNLDRTWRDVMFKQYAADHEADVPSPMRCLPVINVPMVCGLPGRDIWIEATSKIDSKTYKKALLAFTLAPRNVGDPTYSDEHITVRPRKPQSTDQPGISDDEEDNDDDSEAGTHADGAAAGV